MSARVLSSIAVALFVGAVTVSGASAEAPAVSKGLEFVGATDWGLPFPTANTEIETRGTSVYVGSFFPLDDNGQSAFKVGDVSDPANPSLATHFMLPGAVLDTQVNNDVDRCGYGKDLLGLSDPACNTVLTTTQSAPADVDGAWLFDAREPANAQPWGWDASKPFVDQVGFIQRPAVGSHNGFLFGDFAFVAGIGEASFEIWDISPLFGDPPAPPVLAATYSNLTDPRPVRPQRERERSHDLFVQRNPEGRVFVHVAGPDFYIVDVTDVVHGSTTGDISDHLVAFNNYTDADGTVTVTRPHGGHYAEPTDDGNHAYVGDETGCGEPGIIHIFDTSNLPAVGETPKQVGEVGTLTWPTADVPQCANRHADDATPDRQNRNGDTQNFCRTGHNFRIYGDLMTHGNYCEGAFIWDISSREDPELLAQHRSVGDYGGKRRDLRDVSAKADLHSTFWQAVSDGDPEALLAGEQYIYGSDLSAGLVVLRMRPTGNP